MTSRVDTHIRCCLKNNSSEIRESSSAAHLLTMQFLLKYWFPSQNFDWNPGGRTRQLCMQITSPATSKGCSFPCSCLLISSVLEKVMENYQLSSVKSNGGSVLLPGDGNFCPWMSARHGFCGKFLNSFVIFCSSFVSF